MKKGFRKVAAYGGSGAGMGAITAITTGAKAVGVLGGVSAGSSALPVFVVVGAIGGLAVYGIKKAFS